jgi:hypothetical protein
MFGRRPTSSVPRPADRPGVPAAPVRSQTPGQLAYEARRAARAGMSVEKWREARIRAQAEAQAAIEAARPRPQRPPSLFRRLLDRAHKPL